MGRATKYLSPELGACALRVEVNEVEKIINSSVECSNCKPREI